MISKVTLNEISSEIQISRTTIYKVINNKGFVSEKTKKKVLVALKKYNYVPNYNARELAKRKRYQIAYIGMRHLSAQYFASSIKEGMTRAYDDFVDNGLELLIADSDFNDPHKQLEDIDKMREQRVENFIIAPNDMVLMKPKVQELLQQNCNIILLSRYVDIPNRTYVGVNYYRSGMLAGEMLTKIMPEGGKIAVVTNMSRKTDDSVRQRYEGFADWVQKHGNYEIIETIENVNTDEQAQKTFDWLCDKYVDFNGLDAVYDITYKLNILADKLSAMNATKKLKLVGFDVYSAIVEHVHSSVVDIIIGQQLKTQAYDAVRMMFHKICYGIDYKEMDYYSKLDVVVSSNIDCFI